MMARKDGSTLRSAVDANTLGKFRADHPDTSIAAAHGIKTGTSRRKVYDALAKHQRGLTDEEIVELTGLNPSTARPRRIELVEMGLVVDSGFRRRTDSGMRAIRWQLRRPDGA